RSRIVGRNVVAPCDDKQKEYQEAALLELSDGNEMAQEPWEVQDTEHQHRGVRKDGFLFPSCKKVGKEDHPDHKADEGTFQLRKDVRGGDKESEGEPYPHHRRPSIRK